MKIKDRDHKKINSKAIYFMPHDKESFQILTTRAENIAKPLVNLEVEAQKNQFIHFTLGRDEHYGITYQFIKEVLQQIYITPVPCVPDFIAGVMNFRGKLISVLNLSKFFNIEKANNQDKNNVIIINKNKILLGILADDIIGSDTYNEFTLSASLPTMSNEQTSYFLGLHQGNTAIINIDTILSDPKFKILI